MICPRSHNFDEAKLLPCLKVHSSLLLLLGNFYNQPTGCRTCAWSCSSSGDSRQWCIHTLLPSHPVTSNIYLRYLLWCIEIVQMGYPGLEARRGWTSDSGPVNTPPKRRWCLGRKGEARIVCKAMYLPSLVTQSRVCLQCGRPGFNPWVRTILWRRKWWPTHSSILAWRIPWTEEPGRLQFIGSQRVGQDWVTNTFTSFSYTLDCMSTTLHKILSVS